MEVVQTTPFGTQLSDLRLGLSEQTAIGYDRAARIARHAHETRLSLREAALAVGGVSAAEFDAWVDVRRMLGPR